MKNLYLIFILAALFLVNCATLTRGTNEPYKVVTQPPGAVVTTTLETVDSIKARKNNPDLAPSYHGCSPTPCEFIVPRRSKFIVRIEREDYEPARVIVRSKASLTSQGLSTLSNPSIIGASLIADAALSTTAVSASAIFSSAAAAGVTATGTAILASPLIATDVVSGATLSLYPNPVALQLNPVGVTTEYNYDLDTLTDPNQTYARKKAANSCGFDKIICE